jgi:toxin YoeB
MEVRLNRQAQDDLTYWRNTGNQLILKKISRIIDDIIDRPFEGIGKPEPLRYEFSGKWSRRITKADRLIYSVEAEILKIYSMRGHYNK